MKKILLALLVVAAATLGYALAQDDDRSRFVRFVERQISTPDRQIRLGRIDGALSSDVRISQITIADREGVWLTISDVHLIWSRLALLRGRLDVDLLEASSITIARAPLPAEGESEPLDDTPFELPDLPVEILLGQLSVPDVSIAEGIIGPAARLSVDGSIDLAGGALDTNLSITRLDSPGALDLVSQFSNDSRELLIDLAYEEPSGGVLASALNIEGEPDLTFSVFGRGPLDSFRAEISLVSGGNGLLTGAAMVQSPDGGRRFTLDLDGNLRPLVPALYAPFVDEGSTVWVDVTLREDGTVALTRGSLTSGVARLSFSGDLAADFVPVDLTIDGTLNARDDRPLPLPAGNGASIGGATIAVRLDSTAGTFNADIGLEQLNTAALGADSAAIRADGTVQNLADPQARALSFRVTGNAAGLSSSNADVADALGGSLSVAANGSWMAGRPVTVDGARVAGETVEATFAGRVGDSAIGTYTLNAANIAAFSGLAGRDLSGAVDVSARGTIAPAGLFDLSVDATLTTLTLGSDALNGLLGGTTRITGSASRQADRLSFQAFRVAGDALSIALDGTVSDTAADLSGTLSLADLNALDPRISGAVMARAAVTGRPSTPTVSARVESAALTINQETISSLQLAFDGTYDRTSDVAADIDGDLALNARINGEPARLSTTLTTSAAGRQLDALVLSLLGATANGSIALSPNGLADGRLALNVPDLAPIARLALIEATGALGGTLTLTSSGDTQNADINATIRQLAVPGAQVGFAAVDMSVFNARGIPTLNGTAEASAVRAAGFDVRSARIAATGEGASTDLSVRADLASGRIAADGRLSRTDDGFAVRLASLDATREDIRATLLAPTTFTKAGETLNLAQTTLSLGGGQIALQGTLANTVNLSADLQNVPLALANIVRPDLGLAGRVSGALTATGPLREPNASVRIDATRVTAALLAERGIEPLTITGSGEASGGTFTIAQLETAIGGGELTASGTVGRSLDLNVRADRLPLALANTAMPELGLTGTLSGTAALTGTPADPSADVNVTVEGASAAMLRRADLPALSARVAARYADGTADIAEAIIRAGTGSIRATGKVGETLDLNATLDAVPLAYANAAQPGLGLSGDLNGSLTASGTARSPNVTFRLDAPNISAAGLPPAAFAAAGTADRRGANLSSAQLTVGGGVLEASGLIGTTLNLRATARALPLSIANAFASGLGLSGALTADATVTGRLARPNARFTVAVPDLSAAPLAQAGVGALAVRASGQFDGTRIVLVQASADGSGLAARASGTVPLSGGGLNVQVNATAPLALADRFVAERGARFAGEVTVDARVTGALSQPAITGAIRSADFGVRDPQTGLNLTGGTLSARLDGQRVVIETLRAVSGEGSVAASGTIGISGDFPADLTIALRDLRLADGRLYVITVSADATLRGPLTAGPLLSGEVSISRAEVAVPTQLSGSPSLIAVEHFNIPPQVLETLRRARAGPFAEQERARSTTSALRLDMLIDAPARIFIRGRGIDAELGGSVRLTGPVENIVPVGGFELIRGRLSILTQRIDFREGSLAFLGDLNPFIRLVAETRTDSVTIQVVVEGPAESPEIRIESQPQLPQDEALAQLLFGRSISDLSAFQLAQLAASLAELAGGGGGPGILGQVRAFSGLDDIDITTDPDEGTQVRAGRYIADNIYLGVVAGEQSSGVAVNLDVTRDLKLRAETLTNESTFGIFFEREY